MVKKTNKTRGWPPERRAAQAERMRKTKPWEKTTGPKTAEGKAKSSANAYKDGAHDAETRAMRKWLSAQKQFLKALTSRHTS